MSIASRPDLVRGRVTDPLVVGVLSLGIIALHGYGGPLTRDLGVFTYGGLNVVHGVPPYVGVFNSVGPLSDLLPGLGIWLGRLGDLGPVLSERLLFSVLAAGCCALICVLARDVFGSRAAAFVAPAVLLTYQDFLALAADGPREKTAMVLFLLAALVLVVRKHWLAAGACTALATLAWQPALLPACVAALVGVATLGTGRLRAAGSFVLGGLIPSALAVVYFASQHALHVALQGFLFINLNNTQQPSLITAPRQTMKFLVKYYHWSLWVAVAGLVALAVLSIVALIRGPRRTGLLAIGASGVAAAVWTAFVINGPPDLFVVLPFAALGVAGSVAAVAVRLRPWHARALAGAVTAAAVVAAGSEAIATRNDGLDVQQDDVAAVLAAAPPGASIVSFNAPEVLALAGRTNPSPFQIFNPSEIRYLDQTIPDGVHGYADWVAQQHPTFVVVLRHRLPGWAPLLRHDYEYVGRGPGWSWYIARSVGTTVADRVLEANRSQMRAPALNISDNSLTY